MPSAANKASAFRFLLRFKRSRSSMYRAPRFERGGCRRESCREYQFTGMWLNPNSRGSRLRIWQPWGAIPFMPTNSRRLASEGTADPSDLRSLSLPGASPGAPTGVWLIGNSRPVRLKSEQPWECKSPRADQSFGMSTGQADRASVLTSACLRASGASPRHSASLCRLPPLRA